MAGIQYHPPDRKDKSSYRRVAASLPIALPAVFWQSTQGGVAKSLCDQTAQFDFASCLLAGRYCPGGIGLAVGLCSLDTSVAVDRLVACVL